MEKRIIALFEQWSAQQLADQIEAAVSGWGTDEESLVDAVKQITDKATLWQVNKILKSSDKYSYASVRKAVAGELGAFDSDEKSAIYAHLKSIGSNSEEDDDETAMTPDQVIDQIIPRVKQHEGVKPAVYKDSKGIPTVGVGFNLTRADSVQKLKAVGANATAVKAGRAKLSEEQINTLLKQDLKTAKDAAIQLIPNFTSLPAKVQGVLIEMVFNLGKAGLSEFKNFLANIQARNFKQAAIEMLDSAWAKQVGQRANTLSDIMKTA